MSCFWIAAFPTLKNVFFDPEVLKRVLRPTYIVIYQSKQVRLCFGGGYCVQQVKTESLSERKKKRMCSDSHYGKHYRVSSKN